MPFDDASLREALHTLGAILEDRRLAYEVVVIGGGALVLVGLIRRATKDLDVVAIAEDEAWVPAKPMPEPLAEAVRDVSVALDLAADWLNGGPTDLLSFGLPDGFVHRTSSEHFGSLTVRYAARVDQIAFKLYAAADHWPDRGKHLQDLRALGPTVDEITAAAAWCATHDPSEGFREMQLAPILRLFGPAHE